MKPLSRDQILAAHDLNVRQVSVPEWGGSVYLRVLSGKERLEFEETFERERKSALVILLAYTLCDERGTRIFTADDIEALQTKSFPALYRLHRVASRMNALTPADLKELEGNSDASPSDASRSA